MGKPDKVAIFKLNIRRLYLFKFFQSMHFFSGVLMPFFTIWGGISYFQVMLLQAWFVLWTTVLEIPTGAIADQFGRKFSVLCGVVINIAAVIVYSSRPDFMIFLLAEFLWALSTALVSGAETAILYDSLKLMNKEKDSKKVMARFSSSMALGLMVAAPIGSFIGARFGLQYATRAMAVPLLLAAYFILRVKEPQHKSRRPKNYFEILFEGVNYFRRHRVLRILAYDSAIVTALTFYIIWLYQPMLLKIGMPLAYLGIVSSLGVLCEIIIQNNFPALERFFGSKKNYAFISAIIISGGFILLSMTSDFMIGAIISIMTIGFGFTRGVLFTSYMNKYILSRNRATVLSSISMLEKFIRGMTYPIIGLLMQYSLSMTAFAIGIFILIVLAFSKVEEKLLLD